VTGPEPGGRVAVVVGNPKPASRTPDAGIYLATELSGQAPEATARPVVRTLLASAAGVPS
jgi:hypothetical protein